MTPLLTSPRQMDICLIAWPGDFMSDRKTTRTPAQAPRVERPLTAAQRASEANRAQQLAIHNRRAQPSDRRSTQDGETSTAGLDNDHRPVGMNRR